MNLGIESETLEFKKTTGEADKAMDNIASMLNKHGHGTLYFGVSPNGEVTGQLVSASSLDDVARKVKEAIRPVIHPEVRQETLDGRSVIRVDFFGSEKPYFSFGRYYKRVFDRTEEMTPEELKRMMAATDRSSYWENNLTPYGIEALDESALLEFYRRAVSCGRLDEMASFDAEELLSGLGLYEQGKLTNAGFHLFSNRKPAVLKMAVYVTDERIDFSDIDRIEDNVFNLIRKGFSFIKEHIRWRVEPGPGTSRIEVPEIPVEAIREIVVNSFAHADYRGISEHEIVITPTRLEIYNPGEFPAGLSPEMFVRQRIRSMPRNRVILSTLYKSKDVEIFGSGFRRVYALCNKHRVDVESAFENGGFSFSFFRDAPRSRSSREVSTNAIRDVASSFASAGSAAETSTEWKVYALLREDPAQTREVLAQKTGRTVRTIQRALDKLVAGEKIKRIGSNKKGYWKVS